jgi:hypothetical protein
MTKREKHMIHMRAWRHGAKGIAPDQLFTEHHSKAVREIYAYGYERGRLAHADESQRAAGDFDYTPTVLRGEAGDA